jgi:geranylgeranyl diphosphate synthase type I
MATMEDVTEGRSVPEVLAWSRTLVEPALRAAVDTLPTSIRRVAGYHFGWWDENGRPAGVAGGKALRPTLALLTCMAVGGDPTTAVPAAVAVELVHNFSLLHDDVMDGDVTRRHRPTVWCAFSTSAAILVGDALLTLAFDVLAASRHPVAGTGVRMLSTAVQDLVDGQCADISFEERADVGLSEALSMAENKSGALLGCASALGASFGGGGPEQIAHLHGFGERLGLAFQVIDDLLGIWGDPEMTGKPVHSDLHSRKKSLPVVAALTSGTPAGQELAALYLRGEPLSGLELSHTAELIDSAGGRSWSRTQADSLLAEALGHLRAAKPVPRTAGELRALAGLITRRDH